MEADIQWRYHVDNAALSWRTRAAYLRHLPADCAIAAIGRDGPHWSLTDHLLDDARMWLAGIAGVDAKHIKPHPQRPLPRKWVDPARQKKLIDLRARQRERRRAIQAGEIT